MQIKSLLTATLFFLSCLSNIITPMACYKTQEMTYSRTLTHQHVLVHVNSLQLAARILIALEQVKVDIAKNMACNGFVQTMPRFLFITQNRSDKSAAIELIANYHTITYIKISCSYSAYSYNSRATITDLNNDFKKVFDFIEQEKKPVLLHFENIDRIASTDKLENSRFHNELYQALCTNIDACKNKPIILIATADEKKELDHGMTERFGTATKFDDASQGLQRNFLIHALINKVPESNPGLMQLANHIQGTAKEPIKTLTQQLQEKIKEIDTTIHPINKSSYDAQIIATLKQLIQECSTLADSLHAKALTEPYQTGVKPIHYSTQWLKAMADSYLNEIKSYIARYTFALENPKSMDRFLNANRHENLKTLSIYAQGIIACTLKNPDLKITPLIADKILDIIFYYKCKTKGTLYIDFSNVASFDTRTLWEKGKETQTKNKIETSEPSTASILTPKKIINTRKPYVVEKTRLAKAKELIWKYKAPIAFTVAYSIMAFFGIVKLIQHLQEEENEKKKKAEEAGIEESTLTIKQSIDNSTV